MDTLRTPETPRAPRTSTARRNLFTDFENMDPPVCQTPEFPSPISPEMDLSVYENDNDQRWRKFVTFWIIFIIGCVSAIAGFYNLWPSNLVIKFTREFQILIVIILTSVIFLSMLWKTCSKRVANHEDSVQPEINTSRRRTRTNLVSPADSTNVTRGTPAVHSDVHIQIKRTFKGDGTIIWGEFIRYFENVASLNQWTEQRMARILLTTLRDQAEAFAYGLPENTVGNYQLLKGALNQRFGHTALKESYIAEAKLRRKQDKETFRDFGQAIQDLYRRAYPENREYVLESSMKTFLDNCSASEEFRLAVKRTRPKTLDDAVTAAMQEECIRSTENKRYQVRKDYQPPVYNIDDRRYAGKGTSLNTDNATKRCYKCNSSQHLLRNCPKKRLSNNNNGLRYGKRYANYSGTGDQQLNQSRPRQ